MARKERDIEAEIGAALNAEIKAGPPLTGGIGAAILRITTGSIRNVLAEIDSGKTTDQIRESLDRLDKGEAIRGEDTGRFVLDYFKK